MMTSIIRGPAFGSIMMAGIIRGATRLAWIIRGPAFSAIMMVRIIRGALVARIGRTYSSFESLPILDGVAVFTRVPFVFLRFQLSRC